MMIGVSNYVPFFVKKPIGTLFQFPQILNLNCCLVNCPFLDNLLNLQDVAIDVVVNVLGLLRVNFSSMV